MTLSWESCTIQDFVERGEAEIKTGPFGTQLHASDYVDEGIPIINARNIGFGEIRIEKLEFISAETVQRLSSHLLEARDIVFGRKGTVERHVFIQADQAGWFQGTDCLRLRLKSPSVDPRFVSYCFLTENHKRWMINQSSHGATMTSLNQDIIKRIPLRLPPLPIQRRIASILSAYDDLIENNTRRIKLLEEMARLVYREWFAEFRAPGVKLRTATPEEQKVTGKDVFPAGWEISRLGNVAVVNPSSIKRGQEPEVINYVDIASVSTGQIDKIEHVAFGDAPGRARRIVQNGDIIWSCVRPNRKSYSLILNPVPNLIVSTGFAVLRSTNVPFTFLYQAVTTDEFVGYLTNHATGAAYPAVVAGDFENAVVVVPPRTFLESFHRITADAFYLRQNLQVKNACLRRTRDLLLPKLVSGEIDVSGIELSEN